MAIRTILCDDHPGIRAGIRLILRNEIDIDLVAEAATVGSLIAQVRTAHPDVVLLDINLPDRDGLGAIGELLAICPGARVVVLTMHDDAAYATHAFALGANGYVLKESAEDLAMVIREVAAGGHHIDLRLRTLVAGSATSR